MPIYTLHTPAATTQDGVLSYEAENDTVAWFVCLQLGAGMYLPERGDGCEMHPSAGYNLYGTQEEADSWIKDTFGNIDQWKARHYQDIVNAFDSFMYSAPDRREDTASILARISNTPSLGNQQAERVITAAKALARSFDRQRQKEIAAQVQPPMDVRFNRNFDQEFAVGEPIQPLKYSQLTHISPVGW